MATGRALRRELTLPAATALVVGQVIAVGIFLTPGSMIRTLASPLWVLIVWAIIGGMAICGALCYGALAARYPQAGGGYVYLREAYGPRLAFLNGWKCFLIMDPGITAALATGLASYIGYIVPLGNAAQRIVGIGAIVALALVHMAGVRPGTRLLTTLAFIYVIPIDQVGAGEAFVAQVGTVLLGRTGGVTVAAIVVVCVLGSLAVVLMFGPRVYFAMARDGLFPAAAASVHPRFGTPARAIAAQAILASVLVALGTFDTIVAYFIFITVAFIALTVAAVFVLARRDPSFEVPGYPWTAVTFLALVAALLALLALNNPLQAILGVVLVALGVPVYAFTRPTVAVPTEVSP